MNVSWDSDSGFWEERGELTHMIGVLTSHTDIGAGLDSKDVYKRQTLARNDPGVPVCIPSLLPLKSPGKLL